MHNGQKLTPPREADLSAVNIPIRTNAHGSRLASYLNPAVPYEYSDNRDGLGYASINAASSASGSGVEFPR
jgi:hypothetical protein